MTQIVKDKYKDARFRKGHVVTEADILLLLSMGKEHLYPLVNSLRIAAISAVSLRALPQRITLQNSRVWSKAF